MLAPTALLLVLAATGQSPSRAEAPAAVATPEVVGAEVASADAELASTATVPTTPSPPAAMPPIVVHSNETMEFSVSYLGLPMGKARIYVGQVEPTVAPVFLQAQTSSLLSFLTLKQHLATYLDVETGLPRSATLDAIEGRYRHTDTVRFDRATNKATVRVKGKRDKTTELDVPPDTIDFVTLVFRLRSLPLEAGERHAFPVLAGRHLKVVTAEVVGRERVSTGIGDLPAVKVRVPTGFSGKFSEKNPTHIWFSDDARRIVVQITSDFAVGHATAGLVSYTPGALPRDATARP